MRFSVDVIQLQKRSQTFASWVRCKVVVIGLCFGVINMYNFLSDSFKYNRERDLGYLVARLFLNKDGHFFVQGKRQLGFLYNDLVNNTIDPAKLKQVMHSAILYVLDFDLLTPPYDQVNQVTVSEVNELNANMQISTGKRLGFRFQSDVEDVT